MTADLTPAQVITRIAEIAEGVAWQAGVGGSELAGQIVSYLAEHPEQIDAFLAEGILSLPPRFFEHGRLTWMTADNRVVSPQECRLARVVKDMERKANDSDGARP